MSHTAGEKVFDLLFVILLPIVCLLLDPGVFSGSFPGSPASLGIPVMVLAVVGLAMTAMALRLTLAGRWPTLDAAVAGAFFLGGAVALYLGVLLTPFTLMGFVVLGLVPFFTAFACFRAGLRGMRARGPRVAIVGGLVTLALAGSYQVGADMLVDATIRQATEGRDPSAAAHEAWRRAGRLEPLVPRREFYRRGMEFLASADLPGARESRTALEWEVVRD